MELEDAPRSWKIVKLVFLRKLDAAPKKRRKKLQSHCVDVGDVEVRSCTCVVLRVSAVNIFKY